MLLFLMITVEERKKTQERKVMKKYVAHDGAPYK